MPRLRATDVHHQALLEAWEQGRFFELREVLTRSRYSRSDLSSLAREAGLDVACFKHALADGRHRERLARETAWAARLGAEDPSMVWNGRALRVSSRTVRSLDQLEGHFAEARARAEALLDEGVPLSRVYGLLVAQAIGETSRAELTPPAQKTGTAIDVDAPRVSVPHGGAPERGEPGAEITIVVFGQFPCRDCTRMAAELERAENAYAGRVRVVFKHLVANHPDAELAARAAACAHAQGRFWEYHDRLLRGLGRLRFGELLEAAVDAGIDVERLTADLEAGRCDEAVARDMADAQVLGVDVAPTLFINGLKVEGYQPFSRLRAVLEEELRPGFLQAVTR